MSSKLKTIYHIADVHIRNVKRHKEYRQVFEKMFEEIRKRGTEDAIIYLAGDIAHAKLEMSPELVNEISWLFKECAKTCPTILITGNHDCNMNNMDRMDVLTPLVDALELENFYYLRDTQVFSIGGIDFSVFSILDNKDNWISADKLFGNKKIALFHGPVDNSQTDIGYVVSSRHFTTDIFDGFDLALLGDIHKRQEMISPKGCKVVYAGSLVQQNFGETLGRHGFLAWDLDTMTYEEIDIPNDYGYYTMDIDNGKVPVVNDMPKHPRLRVRLSNTDTADTKKVIAEIKMKYGVEDFTIIRTDSLSKTKTGDRQNKLDFEDISDINYQNSLINEYVERMMPFVDKKDLAQLERINRDINSRIVHEDTLRNIMWKPIRFEFSNMFSYGEDNKIDFSKLNGLMGLFAPNAQGKSSIFDAISFCLYDKSSRAFKAANILNNRKTDFRCYLNFQVNGVDYFIERTAKTINKGKNVKVDVNFWYIDMDGEKVSLNGTERRDTNQVIEQYVGKYEDFVLTTLSLQGNNSIFIDKSQSERKDLLAQFMGLNVFDKLYETATEDIKEVSVLIKNFKKTDFTTELADKANELKDKKGELKEFEKELAKLNGNKDGLDGIILELSRNLTPIDSNLDLPKLEEKRKALGEDIQNNTTLIGTKETFIKILEGKIEEISQSIDEKKQSNGIDIEIVYSNYQREQKSLIEATKVYDTAKVYLRGAEEKIKHLDKHEYDPNCKFCCDNTFVKDAMKSKEALPQLQEIVKQSMIDCVGIQQTIDTMEGVEEQYNELTDLKIKLGQSKGILKTAEAELKGLETKEELLQTQLDKVEEDIEKYFENEETIESNKELEKQIKELEVEKHKIELDIKDISKQIATTNGSISSLQTYIEGIKQKMSDVKDLEEKNRLYTYYLDAVKRDGIPYELISKALPVIENEINNILAQVVDFGVTMEMDGKSINAKIVYEDQEWPLEMCSGMEKFVSGLAIRVALINVCNLPRPNFLVVDEGFGTLDADNLSSLFMMMQYLKTQFDFIWMISHLEQMRDIVDGLIEIKKDNGFSKIDF
jgi:DNA repair exonuclease SbcCD ATPase subunit/3',5'-cyclic AMP phosphodiesterase CpdA